MNFKKIFILCFMILVFPLSVVSADDVILYISDHDPDNDFNKRYSNTLQSFISRERKNKKIKIEKFLGFDINTTESMELFMMFNRKKIPKALILMVGESNYYNVYGFSKFMKARQSSVEDTDDRNKKDIFEINSEMAKIYEPYKKKDVNPSIEAAYKAVMPAQSNNVFRPKVIPEFYALKEGFSVGQENIASAVYLYKHSWDLIRNKEFERAKEFLEGILEKENVPAMFYYAMASAYLDEGAANSEENALKFLEEGILIDPLNKENVCYKGLISMFMMYKGEITSEILFFSRSLNKSFLNISDEISAITAINTPDYDSKIEIIDDWILFDFEEIQKRCYRLQIPFIFASYPDNENINSLISEQVKNYSKSAYVENNITKHKNDENTQDSKEDDEPEINEDSESYIYLIAEKMYYFLKGKGIVN